MSAVLGLADRVRVLGLDPIAQDIFIYLGLMDR